MNDKKPNVILVFGDQWRAQALGYAGDANVQTPHLDGLAAESVNFRNAVSGCPVCCPARASLLTGQWPLEHRVIVNDVPLSDRATSIAQAFAAGGYDTAYIGKWHVDGRGRSNYIPPERRQGFDYWKVLECTHDYNNSFYYAGDSDEKLRWDGYDAIEQTRDAQAYLRDHSGEKPFLMVLSWGPPHDPYPTAPEAFRALYDPQELELRPNVPPAFADTARQWLAGYYAHCTALDACAGDLLETLDEKGLADDTIFLFFSDHGDMVGSHGMNNKQKPWDESVRVPFLLRYPAAFGRDGRVLDAPIDIPDIMPTVLSLCGLDIPATVQGRDFSGYMGGGEDPSDGVAFLQCPHPFGQWWPGAGGRSFRGLRTARYTYVRSLEGPWLLYDNEADPYQQNNLLGAAEYDAVWRQLEGDLQQQLAARGDDFLPGPVYLERWSYPVGARGTVAYSN